MAGLRLDGIAHRTLAPIDLALDAGERVFVSGPSGSGKSLLLRAIADLDPHRGEVWLGAEPRSRMTPPVWRRRVGLLSAESFWWAETVGAHLPASQTSGPDSGYVNDWLAKLGFAPDVLDWSVTRLSTGERQRLALVRRLAQRPEALLLDEATANLDPVNRDRVETLVETYRHEQEAAVLWVSHDPEQRRRLGGRAFVIGDGRLEPET
ncbi:ABC transporter ATP-binding protein [Allochromatium vinosum]|uniref:ABC transporter related protein n=1 Tax=Allochromatium vinosum (strain ATCC 17899 / DSM 180 / NBRC 103801 / NCIMB 10441 / D) TaxID=572477 RepID=D3RQ28_ALLVD|nr:ATP-binding cassette domain-containing protein [Allochromatium vinosum]ADC63639.1 ABC transporter related protein [Allochromatium vinosum DSM 180]MBK1655219.1 ATP-binding protein [Allochromatium vinosum]